MDEREFRELVWESAPGDLPVPAVETAVDRYVERAGGLLYRSGIQDVYDDARALVAYAGEGGAGASPPAWGEGAGARALSDRLARDLEPWALKRREELSAATGTELPLGTLDEAISWLREVAAKGRRRQAGDPDERGVVPLPDLEAGHMEKIPVAWASPLQDLALEVKRIAKMSRLSPWSLLAYVVLGWRPKLQVVQVRQSGLPFSGWSKLPGTSDSGVFWPPAVTVTFLSPEITIEELKEIHRTIRSLWGHDHAPLTERQRLVLQIVEEMGGGPERGQWEAFWTRVGERMADVTDGAITYGTAEGPYMLWKEARAKAGALLRGGDARPGRKEASHAEEA